MLVFIIMWLAALGFSMIISLGIMFIQYKVFIKSPEAKIVGNLPTYFEFVLVRFMIIGTWLKSEM